MNDRRTSENMVLRLQCEEILKYVSQYPPEEKEQRILEWIEKYTAIYRENMDSILAFVEKMKNR